MSIPKEFVVWFAGFLDGDGNIFIRKSGKSRLAVRLTTSQCADNNGEVVCKEIQSYFGGYVESRMQDRKDGYNRCPMFTWRIDSRYEVNQILTAILPYLRVKREAAIEALAIISEKAPITYGNWSEQDVDFIKANYLTMQYRDIANQLHRSVKATRNFIHTLGLPNKIKRGATL